MPLLPNGDYICFYCEEERAIADDDWIRVEDDDSVFTSPPCPLCASQETFCFHDDIPVKTVLEQRSLGHIDEDGPEQFVTVGWHEPDPDAFDAIHMALIEEKAQRLGISKRSIPGRMFEAWDRPPKKPTMAEMRKRVKDRARPIREATRQRTKQQADELEAAARAGVDEARSARREAKERAQEAAEEARRPPKPQMTGRPSVAPPTAPEKDAKAPVVVDNEPEEPSVGEEGITNE